MLAPDALGHWVIKTGSGDETRLIRRPVTWHRRVQQVDGATEEDRGRRLSPELVVCRAHRYPNPSEIAAAIECVVRASKRSSPVLHLMLPPWLVTKMLDAFGRIAQWRIFRPRNVKHQKHAAPVIANPRHAITIAYD